MNGFYTHLGDLADIIDDAVEALQQLRYGNEQVARVKLLKVSNGALSLYNALTNKELTAGSEDEGE
jgi:hypothetical protein